MNKKNFNSKNKEESKVCEHCGNIIDSNTKNNDTQFKLRVVGIGLGIISMVLFLLSGD